MVGFTANAQHLFALYLQLSGQSVDGLVQRVDLVVQIGDAVATGTQLRLQLRDSSKELLLLEGIHEVRRLGRREPAENKTNKEESKTLTCWCLCSIAFSRSRLTEELSLWWNCFRCSMDEAWRWLSSARRDAAGERAETSSVMGGNWEENDEKYHTPVPPRVNIFNLQFILRDWISNRLNIKKQLFSIAPGLFMSHTSTWSSVRTTCSCSQITDQAGLWDPTRLTKPLFGKTMMSCRCQLLFWRAICWLNPIRVSQWAIFVCIASLFKAGCVSFQSFKNHEHQRSRYGDNHRGEKQLRQSYCCGLKNHAVCSFRLQQLGLCVWSFTQLGFPLIFQLKSQRLELLVRLLSQDVEGPPVGLLQSVDLLPLLLLQALLQCLAEGGKEWRL